MEYFKVDSNGRVGTPFNRWHDVVPSRKADVVRRLNQSVGHVWFSVRGKLSVDIGQLMPHETSVANYIATWKRFADMRRRAE